MGRFVFSLSIVLLFLAFIHSFDAMNTFSEAQTHISEAARLSDEALSLLNQIEPVAGGY